jgi:hypothetical protein
MNRQGFFIFFFCKIKTLVAGLKISESALRPIMTKFQIHRDMILCFFLYVVVDNHRVSHLERYSLCSVSLVLGLSNGQNME